MRRTFGFSRTFVNVSARRFPGRSGTASVLSSRTRTKPGPGASANGNDRRSTDEVPYGACSSREENPEKEKAA